MSTRGSQGQVERLTGAVALSGGVDSTVTAQFLKEQGHDIFGVTMHLGGPPPDVSVLQQELGIKVRVLDLRDEFRRSVIDEFCREYSRGRTPNPCVTCNRALKFGRLAAYARSEGAAFLATGHYARRLYSSERGCYGLHQARHEEKDQSYMLYGLSQEQLAFARFPLGHFKKEDVRQRAQLAGLSVADASESQDICFITGDYRHFLKEHLPGAFRPGPIVNRHGQRLGTHDGLAGFTIGQRRGLGIRARAPQYVIALDTLRNALVVGAVEDTWATGFVALEANYLAQTPPPTGILCTVKVRYRAPKAPCRLYAGADGRLQATFTAPQRAVTPGQSAVFYDGDEVLGGGIIQLVCMTMAP